MRLAPVKIQISTDEWVHKPIALLDSLILDRTEKRSLQRQLCLELKRLIQRGALPPGGPVPSSRALAEDLRVSRNTVTAAYDRLVGEGYLDARPRSGLFVSASLASVPCVRTQRRAIRPALDPDDTAPALREPRPFRPSQPDVRLFPLTVWNRLRTRRLCIDSAALLHYQSGLAMGLKELRQALAAYLRDSRGVECDWRQVAITSGSQHRRCISSGSCCSTQAIECWSKIRVIPAPECVAAARRHARAGAGRRAGARDPADARRDQANHHLLHAVAPVPDRGVPTGVATTRGSALLRIRRSAPRPITIALPSWSPRLECLRPPLHWQPSSQCRANRTITWLHAGKATEECAICWTASRLRPSAATSGGQTP